MNYLLAILAGAVQGLTEFLPVSSTGHLIIFEHFFHLSPDRFGLTFDVSLHLGTLLAIAVFFWKDYLSIFNLKNQLLGKLAIGTIPAAAAGLVFEKTVESTLRQIWVVALVLIIFSFALYLAEKFAKQKKTKEQISQTDSFVIGLFQALALIPGVSRSGSTISAGLFLGVKREEAAKFAFILSGPVIAAAGAKKFLEALTRSQVPVGDLAFFIIGIVSSAIFGYLTIKYFLQYLSKRTLYPFIIYRIALGLILLWPYLTLNP